MTRKKCKTCKKKRARSRFRAYTGKSGNTLHRSHCIDCERKRNRLRDSKGVANRKKRKRDKQYKRSPKGRFMQAKNTAKRKNIDWTLSEDEYARLIGNDCFYCNGYFPPVKVGIGLDRKQSSQGYILSNVVACCEICNKLKNNFLTPDETKVAVRAIIKMRRGKK